MEVFFIKNSLYICIMSDTLFTTDNQPLSNGRPSGTQGVRHWSTLAKKYLGHDGWVTFNNVQEIGDDGLPTGRVFDSARVRLPNRETIMMSMISAAVSGGAGAIKAAQFLREIEEGLERQEVSIINILNNYTIENPTAREDYIKDEGEIDVLELGE